mgnify:CR=1 FL=1
MWWPHKGEPGQVDADALGAGSLADHDVQRVVFQRRVKHFLHLAGKAVDLVDEQHVPFLQVGEQRRQVAGLFDGRAGRDADLDAHLLGDDARQRGLAQTRRAVQQDVVHRFAALLRRPQIDPQVALGFLLPHIIVQGPGAQADFFRVSGQCVGADQTAGIYGIFLIHGSLLSPNHRARDRLRSATLIISCTGSVSSTRATAAAASDGV